MRNSYNISELELQPQLQLQSLLIVKHCNNSCNCNTIEIPSSVTIFYIQRHKIQNSQLQWAPSAAPCGSGLGGSPQPSASAPSAPGRARSSPTSVDKCSKGTSGFIFMSISSDWPISPVELRIATLNLSAERRGP
jgi:hypothetical protein